MQFSTDKKIILASSSPRRKELLSMLNLPFQIVPSSYNEEAFVFDGQIDAYVEGLAIKKAKAVAANYPNALVIGADTIVALHNEILGKPSSEAQAIEYLRRLNGKSHTVQTGVAFCHKGLFSSFSVETTVVFRQVEDALLTAYAASGDPLDKAGGYGIQTLGTLLIDRIIGDYNNVVGLPIASVVNHLLEQGWIRLKEVTKED